MSKPGPNSRCPRCQIEAPIGRRCADPVCREHRLVAFPEVFLPEPEQVLADPIIGRLVGPFPIARKLGAGAFGSVYLGLQPPFWNPVAVKLLALMEFPRGMEESIRAKFKAEAEALSILKHPNIVQLVSYGVDGDNPYLAMEYVERAVTLEDDIAARAAEDRRYSNDELRSILNQLLDGLGAAHEKSIIHRDIKPANLMLQRVKGHEQLVRILDFGLAKFLERGNATMITSGTPDYISPEQLHRKNLGPWSDLYAAGIVAFELITGRKVLPPGTLHQVFLKKIDPGFDPTESITDLALPGEVLSFFKRSLAVDPELRYRNADAMKSALDRTLEVLGDLPEKRLSRVSLEGLLAHQQDSQAPTVFPLTVHDGSARPSSSPQDSDEAFKRWLALEHDRLHKKR